MPYVKNRNYELTQCVKCKHGGMGRLIVRPVNYVCNQTRLATGKITDIIDLHFNCVMPAGSNVRIECGWYASFVVESDQRLFK